MEAVVALGVVVVVAETVAGAGAGTAAGDDDGDDDEETAVDDIAAGGRGILGSGGGRVMGDIARRSCWNDGETYIRASKIEGRC